MLSKFSVKKPLTIYVAVVIVMIFGCISFMKMTPDLFPKINTPYAVIMTTCQGVNPEEAEVQVTNPIEKAVATLSNVKNVTSISGENFSMVSIEFTSDVNMDTIGVDISDKLDQVKSSLPEKASSPVVQKINMQMLPVMIAAVGMEGKTTGEVSEYTEENLLSPLQGIDGVASVSTTGMVDDGLRVVLDEDKINDVNNRVSAAINSNLDSAGNQLNSGINSTKKAEKQLSKGKNKINSSVSKIDSAIKKLQKSKKQLQKLKKQGEPVWLKYQAAKSETEKTMLEYYMKQMGYSSAEEFGKAIQKVDTSISAIDEQIAKLTDSKSTISFNYSDVTSSEASVKASANQLQDKLSEFNSEKEAALASADMTGVLTMENISSILEAQNFSMPAGYISEGNSKMLVSVGKKIKSRGEMEELILMDPGIDGVEPVRLKDVATVTTGAGDSDTYAKINGENGVLMSFSKQSTYATATVADNILDKFDELEEKHEGIHFTPLMNQGEYIHLIINSVLENLALGAILAILILFFFLRDIRPTIITAISIPISVIFAVALMYFSGVTLNMISLSGLAIGVGMLVDNSIVVIENIYRLRSLGYSRVQSAVSGAKQMGGAITASTLTTICVFAPIVFVSGMTKDIFTDLALTVTYSLIASLIIALTLVPAMARHMLIKETGSKKSLLDQGSRLLTRYRKVVAWTLIHKKRVFLIALALLVASSGLLLCKGFEYMPSMASTQVSATIETPNDSTLEETAEINDEIAAEIQKIDGVETVGVMLSTGMASVVGMSADVGNVTNTTLYAVLEKGNAECGKLIAKKLDKLADKYNCKIETTADMDMSSLTGSTDVKINLFSDDLDKLRLSGENIEDELGKMDSLKDISEVSEDTTDELKVVIDRNAAMKKGITVAEIFQQVSAKLQEEKESISIQEGDTTTGVTVENTTKGSFDKNDLENMYITVNKGDGKTEKFRLGSVAKIQNDKSMNEIDHLNQKRTLAITAGVKDGYNTTKVNQEIQKKIEEKDLVLSGVKTEYAGEYKNIMEAMKQMILLFLAGFALVYLIMAAQFQSLRAPLIILFTVPLAITGGMLALLISNQVLSVVAMMGFVMLVGIVVNNGIVLVDCINRFRLEGMDMASAIIQAGSVRIRPVLMTAATTVLGLLPMGLGLGNGSEMVQPLAITCMGGLIYGTLMTLFIVPPMYQVFAAKRMEKIKEEELLDVEE